ncbi:DUF5412 domain-containing protein [Jeotgalibacillus aurantiacus]|uniref:DUF5412 domain-containing protein n=1 Tax=Jeotgalibacillus aurantiacus TaxID=2763266 RepID=UPI002223BC01|nr:DUF5412 domain-containing protein [Jeotgalibacillus aurantiacus]
MTFIKKHPYITGSLVAFMTLLILIAYFIYWAFFSIARLEPGELIAEETSPNGEYTVKNLSE